MNETFELIANGMTSGVGVWIVCSLILFWALISYSIFSRRMRPIVRGVDQAVSDITVLDGESGFAEGFDEFDEKIKANPILMHAWSEFSETLIKDPMLEPIGVRNTRSASDYFYRNSIVGDRINLRFYSALPNLLTGMGILGTFLGLVAGIGLASGKLGSPDVEIVRQALQQLLNGASLAFMTSIAGLVGSLLFSWREKHGVHRLERCIRQWNDALDSRLIRVTGESLATNQLTESRQQTEILTQFTTDLAFQIADAFQDRISTSLGPALDSLVAEVKQMRYEQGKRNDDALQEMISTFSESITGTAGQELSALGSTLSTLNDKLERQVNVLGDRQEQMNEASSKAIEDMTKVFKWSLDQMKSGVKEMLSDITRTVSSLVGEINVVMQSVVSLSSDYNSLIEKTEGVVIELNDAASNMTLVLEPISESVSDIQLATTEIKSISEINGQVAGQINQSINSIATLQSELKDSWERYEDRFDQVDQSMAGTMRELVTGLDTYTERVKEFISGLDKHTSSIVSDLAGANSELTSAVEELSDSLGRVMAS